MRSRSIVVGGGYAGIAAALALADLGEEVTLLEARRHWGGRATSWPDPKMGDAVDNGQHIWFGCYDATRALLRRLGTHDHVTFTPGLRLSYREPGGRAFRLRAPAMFGRAGLLLALARFGALPAGERLALGRVIKEAPAPPPTLTAAQWLDTLGQKDAARRAFWGPLTEAAVNLPLDRAAASLVFEVIARAFRGPASAAAIGLPRVGLAELVAPIADLLAARGGRARLGAAVRAVLPGEESGTGAYQLLLESGESIAADRVILATPAVDARGLLVALPEAAARLAAAAVVPSSPIVTATLWFPGRVLEDPVIGLLAPAGGPAPDFHWVFDRGEQVRRSGDAWPLVLVASAAGAIALLPTAAIVERARAVLADYGVTNTAPLAARVVKEPHATPAFTPEHAMKRPGSDSGREGLAFAGDWTATGMPATIEGAVASGLLAARQVRGSGVPPPEERDSAILRHPTSTPTEGPA